MAAAGKTPQKPSCDDDLTDALQVVEGLRQGDREPVWYIKGGGFPPFIDSNKALHEEIKKLVKLNKLVPVFLFAKSLIFLLNAWEYLGFKV